MNGNSNLLETIIRQFQQATSSSTNSSIKSPPTSSSSNELKVSDAEAMMPSTSGTSTATSLGVCIKTTGSKLSKSAKNKLEKELSELKLQYIKLKQRQLQAELILLGKGLFYCSVVKLEN